MHHKIPLDKGGDPYDLSNIEVLTVDEHIAHHRGDRATPGRDAWRKLVAEIANS